MSRIALKALVIVFFLITFLSNSVLGQEGKEVIVNVKAYKGFVRIWLASEDERYIQEAKISEAYSIVRIDFQVPFKLVEASRDSSVLASRRGTSLFLQISNLERIKVIKLPNPPKLVIDAHFSKVKQSSRSKKSKGLSVIIDPGHGGSDRGLVFGQIKESRVVLQVSKVLYKAIKGSSKKVYLTRVGETNPPIELRIRDIMANKPDMFISVHMSKWRSFSIYTATPVTRSLLDPSGESEYTGQFDYMTKSSELKSAVGQSLERRYDMEVNYGDLPLPILYEVSAPAIYIELPSPEFFVYNEKSMKIIADAIKEGIENYGKK